jgi:hypothetical protein
MIYNIERYDAGSDMHAGSGEFAELRNFHLHHQGFVLCRQSAIALCDEKHGEEKLKNVEDVFVANGFERQKVREYMQEDKRERNESEEQEYRGMIIVPLHPGLIRTTPGLIRLTTFKPGNKIKELKAGLNNHLSKNKVCCLRDPHDVNARKRCMY